MGGGGLMGGALPVGASGWCPGDDVIQGLNDVFDVDPTCQAYQDVKTASLPFFQTAARTGSPADLYYAYGMAFGAVSHPVCSGWSFYLNALGNLTPTPGSNGGNVATASATNTGSSVLDFGANNVPDWMAVGLNVSDSTTPGAIISGQTVSDFDTATVTLTAPVDATVNSRDVIVFALPGGLGTEDIKAIARTRYTCLNANVRMMTSKHHPHTPKTSGHAVKVGGGIIVTTSLTNTSSKVLTFGAGNVPSWMEKGLNVYDASDPDAIAQGHKVHDFDNATVTLTTKVDATVNAGATIVFSPPPLVGKVLIDSPYIPPAHALQSRRGFRQWLRRCLQSRS